MSNRLVVRVFWIGLLTVVVGAIALIALTMPDAERDLPAVAPPLRQYPPPPPGSFADEGCRDRPASSTTPTAPVREIYGAVFGWLHRMDTAGMHGQRPAHLVVKTPTLRLPPLALRHGAGEFAGMPRSMRYGLADGIETCIVLDPASVPGDVVILDADELGIENGRIDWERFAQSVPNARGWFGLSQPLLSSDGADAVVYVAWYCPGCGEGRWVWLHRDAGGWNVRAHVMSWIS